MNKFVETNEKIANGVKEGYKKIEDGVVSGYKKIEDKFVDTFLKKYGETTEEAKCRIAKEQEELTKKNKELVNKDN